MNTEKRHKESDEVFCSSCGEPIKKEAVICIHCGVQVRPLIPQRGNKASASSGLAPFPAQLPASTKSKTTAVLLAVFLSYWTWLYTLQRDKAKFIIGLVSIPPTLYLRYYYGPDALEYLYDLNTRDPVLIFCRDMIYLTALVIVGLWIWAIIESSVRSKNWYDSYPNG